MLARVLVMVAVLPAVAAAEGERSPMIGGSLVAARSGDEPGVVGVGLEATYWWHRLGVAVEGSRRWDVESGEPASTTLVGGLRVLVADRLLGSVIEPRDLELGLELQGVVEQAWFDAGGRDVTYGAGVALRLRGGGDAFDEALLAETRLFVRVMTPRERALVARSLEPMAAAPMTILVGLGAVWGAGERRYADKLRSRFATPIIFPANPAN